MNGPCFSAGFVLREKFFGGGNGTRTEVSVDKNLPEIGWYAEVDSESFS